MLIYFVRHGQTDQWVISAALADKSNVQGIIQGNMDTRLNDRGRKELRLLAESLKSVPFIEARSSQLSRAFESAEMVAALHPGLEVVADPGMRERGLGSLEGKRWQGGPFPADAEQGVEFRARVRGWLEGFLAAHTEEGTAPPGPGEPVVLCVSHGAWLSTLLRLMLSPSWGWAPAPGGDFDASRSCHNTSVMRVRAQYDPDTHAWSGEVLSWADVSHLGSMTTKLTVADDVRLKAFRKAVAQA